MSSFIGLAYEGTFNSAYNEKKYEEILLHYRQLFVKGNVFIGERGIFGAEVFLHYRQFFIKSNFIRGRVECISSFLHHKWNNALHKAANAITEKANIQCNKLMKLDSSMLMYGIYNAKTFEKLIKTVHRIHNTSSHERLFAGDHNHATFRIFYAHSLGLQHYSTNSLLYLRIIQDKYVALYREIITQLCTYVSAIRVLAKGYLPNTLIKPAKLQEILMEVKKTLQITNLDYDLVLDRLHLYYDMPLITFSIDKDMNLIIQFPVFVQPYNRSP